MPHSVSIYLQNVRASDVYSNIRTSFSPGEEMPARDLCTSDIVNTILVVISR